MSNPTPFGTVDFSQPRMKTLRFTAILLLACGLCYCDEKKETAKDLEHEDDHIEVTTHRPVFGFPQFPSFPALFPSVGFPQFQFPQFPALPQLPTFHHLPPPFKRETITATKTVFVETTKRVTRHPICVTAYGHKPPCLLDHQRDAVNELEQDLEDQRSEILPTAVPAIPIAETRILAKITESDDTVESAESQPIEAHAAEKPSARTGRYLVPHPIPMIPKDSQIRSEPAEHVPESEKIVEGLLKATHIITKTLWVTKVEKVIDHAVTATLVAKNCYPVDPRIPNCGPTNHGGSLHWKENDEQTKTNEEGEQ